jgi:hypothetical protein
MSRSKTLVAALPSNDPLIFDPDRLPEWKTYSWLKDAREIVCDDGGTRKLTQEEVQAGVKCTGQFLHGCGRETRVDYNRITRQPMLYLSKLYKLYDPNDPKQWYPVSSIRIARSRKRIEEDSEDYHSGDYMTLVRWGLVEMNEDEPGLARLTPRGVEFYEGGVRVPETCFVENDRKAFRGFVPGCRMIDITQAWTMIFSKEGLHTADAAILPPPLTEMLFKGLTG